MDIDKSINMVANSTIYLQNAKVSRRQYLEAFAELSNLARIGSIVVSTVHEHGDLRLKHWDDPSEIGYRAWIPSTRGCECHPTIERAIEAAVNDEYFNKS